LDGKINQVNLLLGWTWSGVPPYLKGRIRSAVSVGAGSNLCYNILNFQYILNDMKGVKVAVVTLDTENPVQEFPVSYLIG
jgi:hypothetical protein